MQFSVEDVSSVKKKLHVEIPQEDVARKLDEAYSEVGKTAKVKGFRKGRVPKSVLERHYSKSVNSDVTQKLIEESLYQALKDTGFKVVGPPQVDISQPDHIEKDADFTYDVTVEIAPEIGDLDYKGLELNKSVYTVNEDEVEKQLEMLQQTMTDKKPITEDRPAKEGDFVLIDYEGFEEESSVPEIPKSENYTLKIGAGVIHKDFDEQLIGMKPGDKKKIRVTFSQDHQNQSLAGKQITFQVELKEIRKGVPYELDDEFARKMGNYETLDQLREAIAENLKEGYEKRIEHELNEQAFMKLLEKADFEVPEIMVSQELDQIVSDIEKKIEAHGKTMEELGFTRESLAEKNRETAENQVKRHILLNKIIEQENLELTDEELAQGFEEMARSMGQPKEVVKKFYELHKESLEFFKHTLLEKKVMKLIIDNSIITEKESELQPESEENEEREKSG